MRDPVLFAELRKAKQKTKNTIKCAEAVLRADPKNVHAAECLRVAKKMLGLEIELEIEHRDCERLKAKFRKGGGAGG